MNPLRRLALRLRAVFGRPVLENDMQGEMRQHLERAAQRYEARGMSAADARLAAKREFGNPTLLQEEARDARGARWVDAIGGDARFAVRYFARHKATTAIIVGVIALATGMNTFMFSMLQSQFFRAAPMMKNDDAIVRVWADERATRAGAFEPRGFTRPEYLALAQRPELFQDVATFTTEDLIVSAADTTGARTVDAQFVSPNYFRTAGIRLTGGQGFVRADVGDDTPDLAAVVSHELATQLYGSTTEAVGRQVLVNQVPLRIVGITPERFQGAIRNMDGELWIPLSARTTISRSTPARWLDDQSTLGIFARLAPGASREQGTALARQVVNAALPDSAERVGMARSAHVVGINERRPGSDNMDTIMATFAVFGVGALILLVACTNISSLMVANAVGRRHEIAVRLSLGGSRMRLLRQLVTESTVLSFVGAAIGLTAAWWGLVWIAKTGQTSGYDMMPDTGTLAFVFVMALSTGILFGLSPAMHATRGAVAGALRDSGTGASNRSRLQRGLVVAQIALSQPLLVILGIMLTAIVKDYEPLARDMSREVIRVQFSPVKNGAPGQRPDDVDSLVTRIAQEPRVLAAVSDADMFALRGVVAHDRVDPGADSLPTIVTLAGVVPGWLGTVDVPLVFGRDVAWADTTAADYPVVVGSDLARRMWGEANPIGKTLTSAPIKDIGGQTDSITLTIVGVYDAAQRLPEMTWLGYGAGGDQPIHVLTAVGKHWRHDRVLVRTRGPADSYVADLQRYLQTVAPALPVIGAKTLAQIDAEGYADTVKMASTAGIGGALALLLASLGLYGVVSLAVRQRTREIGIRIAIGAHPAKVARSFLVSGLRVSVIAIAIGLPLSIFALNFGIKQKLIVTPGVSLPLLGLAIAAILVAVAAAATWIPARRAALVDPVRSLRTD
jgi:putative ABC transport system permease protein